MSSWSQNKDVLLKNNITTNPRQMIFEDLNDLVSPWNLTKGKVIIAMDANSPIHDMQMSRFLAHNNLTNLCQTTPTRTHHNGRHCIDFIIGSTNVTSSVIHAGYLPFEEGPFTSNHRSIYIDFCDQTLFDDNLESIYLAPKRGVNSKMNNQDISLCTS